jgi:hypothetical protein
MAGLIRILSLKELGMEYGRCGLFVRVAVFIFTTGTEGKY